MAVFVRMQEIEHPIGAGGRFALRVTSPEVEITGSDDEVAHVRVTIELRATSEAEADELFEQALFRVTQGEGFLEVTEPRHGETGLNALARIFGKDRSTTERVKVTVPRGAEIQYDGVSADVTASELSGTQRFRTVSGDMVLDRVSGVVRLQGVSSDVSVRSESSVSLEANTVSGDLSIVAPAFETLRIVTVSGDAEVEGSLYPGGSYRIETVSGDLSLGVAGDVTLEVRGLSTDVTVDVPHRAEGSRDRRRYVIGAGGPNLLFSSMSGDVSLRSARRSGSLVAPVPADPPTPTPLTGPIPPIPPVSPAPAPGAEDQMIVLQALERGEIDVDEAARRLEGSGHG